jgi:mono/diheme cytochrome c family protein
MQKLVLVTVFALSVAFSGTALAADGAEIYKNQCATCHGQKGEGIPMMGPALKDFVSKSDDAALTDVIIKGRVGDAKKYKDFPIPMMPLKLDDTEMKAVIKHMKGLTL